MNVQIYTPAYVVSKLGLLSLISYEIREVWAIFGTKRETVAKDWR
jgi:hypothetical protein